MRPQVVLEVVVVTLGEKLEESEDAAGKVGVVEILLASAFTPGSQVLRLVRPLERIQVEDTAMEDRSMSTTALSFQLRWFA